MIKFIKGTLAAQTESGIIIETPMGLGFEVAIHPGSPLYKNQEGDEIQVFTEMVVREDDVSLYGFHNMETLEFFKLLTSVSGVGPKVAMGVLGSMPVDQLKQAIAFGDIKAVSQAQGIGKKTAERLILELKDKVGDFETDLVQSGLTDGDIADASGDARQEAIAALISLGYARQEAFKAVSSVGDEGLTSEEYIKKALKNLM